MLHTGFSDDLPRYRSSVKCGIQAESWRIDVRRDQMAHIATTKNRSSTNKNDGKRADFMQYS